MIAIYCQELTPDEQLALASFVSDALNGKAVAFVKDANLVIDTTGGAGVTPDSIAELTAEFVSKRKDSSLYSIVTDSGRIVVHSPDPLVRNRQRKAAPLPPNLHQCPYCPFVTPSKEEWERHTRTHSLIMGI